jgi:hypothetical protein
MIKEFDPEKCFNIITNELRTYVMVRDNGLCQLCGKIGSDCHHVIFKSQLGDNKANNLIVLCKKCHTGYGGIHGIMGKNLKILYSAIKRNEKKLRERLV